MYLDDFKLNPKLSLTYENRSNNVFTFSNLNPANESYEYSIIPQTDSIAQSQFDLSLRLNNQNDWNQLISARYKLVRKVYWQQAIKSETLIHQYKLFPSFYWNGLYSKQTYSDTINADSEIHNHTLENSWKWIFLTLKNIYLLQKNNYSILKSNTLALEGTKYNKINPQIIFSNNNTLNSEFSYSNEINSHKRNRTWKDLKISDTWQYKQLINKQTNTLALNLTHREVFNNGDYVSAQNKKQVFDLLDLKSSHQLLDNTLSLLTFYQLNQLEFYPKVRELQFVGSGYGLYDSTGVQMVNGDYDYTYINSGTSKMSTEINANLNIFFHLSKKFYPNSIFHRFNFDSSFQITESTEQKSDIKLYLLFPEEVFQQGTTIYGRQYMQHTLWLDIWRKVVTGTIKYETGKTIKNTIQPLMIMFFSERQIIQSSTNLTGNKFWGIS